MVVNRLSASGSVARSIAEARFSVTAVSHFLGSLFVIGSGSFPVIKKKSVAPSASRCDSAQGKC